ncbi:MAG: nuclear transport factor 2 family protein [Calditrichia bacterium]|nr:nuclear transport factor 2 family protein [Calditrichia bacterium]
MKKLLLLILLTVLITSFSFAHEKADIEKEKAAIKQAALNYIEGWYEGNADRMERALHPELAKRTIKIDKKSGRYHLDQMSAMTLVQITRKGYGKNTPKEEQQKDVTILDIYENTACAKIIAKDWIDYLHLVKWNDEWKIINVLWELKKRDKK